MKEILVLILGFTVLHKVNSTHASMKRFIADYVLPMFFSLCIIVYRWINGLLFVNYKHKAFISLTQELYFI